VRGERLHKYLHRRDGQESAEDGRREKRYRAREKRARTMERQGENSKSAQRAINPEINKR